MAAVRRGTTCASRRRRWPRSRVAARGLLGDDGGPMPARRLGARRRRRRRARPRAVPAGARRRRAEPGRAPSSRSATPRPSPTSRARAWSACSTSSVDPARADAVRVVRRLGPRRRPDEVARPYFVARDGRRTSATPTSAARPSRSTSSTATNTLVAAVDVHQHLHAVPEPAAARRSSSPGDDDRDLPGLPRRPTKGDARPRSASGRPRSFDPITWTGELEKPEPPSREASRPRATKRLIRAEPTDPLATMGPHDR